MSLMLTDPEPRYDIEIYPIDSGRHSQRFTAPIGLDGRYKKAEPTYMPWLGFRGVNAVKGAWLDDHTFVMNTVLLGEGPGNICTFTFDGDKLNCASSVLTVAKFLSTARPVGRLLFAGMRRPDFVRGGNFFPASAHGI
jgi:hypothetical protein